MRPRLGPAIADLATHSTAGPSRWTHRVGVTGFGGVEFSRDQAASSRASSVSNSRRNRLASLSGSQLAICGKMVR